MKYCFSKPFAGFAISILLSFLTISTVQAKPIIEWAPESLEIRQTEGTVKTYTLQVNFNKAATDVVGRVVPALEEWISVNPVSFGDVSKGDTIELELIVSIPSGETAANHGGIVQLRGGKNQQNLAKPLNVSLTIIPQTDDGLPPDPGEAGKETLLGIDSDLDGVRDDIQRYILLTYPNQPHIQNALFQLTKTYTDAFQEGLSDEEIYQIGLESGPAISCLRYFDSANTRSMVSGLTEIILNTPERTASYLDFDISLSGYSFPLTKLPYTERYKLCDFELMDEE